MQNPVMPSSVISAVKRLGRLRGLNLVGPPKNVRSYISRRNGRLLWEANWLDANSKEEIKVTVDAMSGHIVGFSNYAPYRRSRDYWNSRRPFSVTEAQAIAVVKGMNRLTAVPTGDWRIVESELNEPPREYHAFAYPTWQIRMYRRIHGYYSWSEQVYASINPYDSSLGYWSLATGAIYVPPTTIRLSRETAQGIVTSVYGRDARPMTWVMGKLERSDGPFWLPVAPGSPYHRLAYLFDFPPGEGNDIPPSLTPIVDAATGELGYMWQRPVSDSRPAGSAPLTPREPVMDPRFALIAALSTEPTTAGRSALVGKIAAASLIPPSDKVPPQSKRFRLRKAEFAIDEANQRVLWTASSGKEASPTPKWTGVRLSKEDIAQLRRWQEEKRL